MNKVCCYCRKTFGLEHFAKNKATADGLQFRCRECHKHAVDESKKRRLKRGGPRVLDLTGPRSCTMCNVTKPIEDFPLRYLENERSRKRQCRICENMVKASRRASTDRENILNIQRRSKKKHIVKVRELQRERYYALKKKVFAHLGNACIFCGFADHRALQIDHVRGGGSRELVQGGRGKNRDRYMREVLEDRTGKYQILCANCNWIKRYEMFEHPGRKRSIHA